MQSEQPDNSRSLLEICQRCDPMWIGVDHSDPHGVRSILAHIRLPWFATFLTAGRPRTFRLPTVTLARFRLRSGTLSKQHENLCFRSYFELLLAIAGHYSPLLAIARHYSSLLAIASHCWPLLADQGRHLIRKFLMRLDCEWSNGRTGCD